MKVLFYGSRGWIGSMFLDYLIKNNKDLLIIEGSARIDSIESVENEILLLKPTHVISFTGRTNGTLADGTVVNTIDYLEHPGKLHENIRDNLFGPMILSQFSNKYNYHYTYLGTGCIFNDLNTTVKYKESDNPDFFGSSYSIVKGFTDRLFNFQIKNNNQNSNLLNLRVRMPISSKPNNRNFINKIIKYSKICSIPNSMTILDDFFPIILDLMIKKKTGTYNCTNPGVISHNEILSEYKNIIDNSFEWSNMTLEEQSQILKAERSNNHLDTTLIESEYPDLPNINTSIKILLQNMKNNIKY